MKLNWFKRTGIFFIPSSLPGWLIFSTSVVYAVYSFSAIDSRSHSVSDTLINFVFRVIIICAGYSLVAYLASSRKSI
jgi:hypothetical protein